ncbi:cysteine metabolism transcriptional regulator CymR [Rubeoparvulum massiliense]|uniref:cysteine metabolism transcriptional regulator CymR n=1 Tax=Rubeoparvulum massiliense TaxID=1631346 RepID=UPI00065DD4CC|nr:Rrf2 family transcriptional regulator [Rubeoparvulum massiliense]
MKITTRGRYGLTVMMELARHEENQPLPLKEIAQRNQLSEHYLEQLIPPLRHASLIKSVRGAYGGYRLSRSPQEITVGEILRALEGPLSPVDFETEEDPAKRRLWLRLRDSIAQVLNGTTLAEMIEEETEEEPDGYMFYI